MYLFMACLTRKHRICSDYAYQYGGPFPVSLCSCPCHKRTEKERRIEVWGRVMAGDLVNVAHYP
jgi:hypothetical protein